MAPTLPVPAVLNVTWEGGPKSDSASLVKSTLGWERDGKPPPGASAGGSGLAQAHTAPHMDSLRGWSAPLQAAARSPPARRVPARALQLLFPPPFWSDPKVCPGSASSLAEPGDSPPPVHPPGVWPCLEAQNSVCLLAHWSHCMSHQGAFLVITLVLGSPGGVPP